MSGTAVRVLAVLELLQAHDKITGAEIAERLDVDARSVRRYIKQIQEMGIPVQSERGRYGAYQLETGYRLPPLMFREEEVTALTLGLLVIRALQFPLDSASIAGALAKIERTVPQEFFEQVRAIQRVMQFQSVPPSAPIEQDIVDTVARGVWQAQVMHIVYESRKGDETARDFNPYGVVFYEGKWYAVGYCQLRSDLRIFRLDRITTAYPTGERFTQRYDFDALAYVTQSLSDPEDFKQVRVLFQTTLDDAQRALPPDLGEFEVVDGGVMFRCAAQRLEWIAALMLSLNFPIRILGPDELKDELRTLAHKALKIIEP